MGQGEGATLNKSAISYKVAFKLCVGLALLLLIKVAFSRLCLRSLQSRGMKQSWHDLVLGGSSDGSRPCLLLEIIINI